MRQTSVGRNAQREVGLVVIGEFALCTNNHGLSEGSYSTHKSPDMASMAPVQYGSNASTECIMQTLPPT